MSVEFCFLFWCELAALFQMRSDLADQAYDINAGLNESRSIFNYERY